MKSSALALLLALAACSGVGTGSTTGSSGTGTTSGATGGSSGFDAGPAITAPAEQWTWVPFPNAFCGNGSPTGIGVNLNPNDSHVLIYLEAGGACDDELTCLTLMTAANFETGYGPSQFAAESTDTTYLAQPGGFFDRTASANPFQTYSYVYVPYCTGDLHIGNNVTSTGHFVGYANLTVYLERLISTFPAATQIVLAGSSAGGFGAIYNWSQVQQAFGSSIPVLVIDDSGTFMPPDIQSQFTTFSPANVAPVWNLAATIPAGCTGCTTDLDAIYAFDAQAFPHQRGALLSYAQDSLLPQFYGISETQFTTGLNEELADNFAPNPNLAAFVAPGQGHVLLLNPQLAVNGVTLQSWIGAMVTDGGWATEQ